mmetsp:Transcript_39250/g.45006  ORF Transcript_39250/g.45006 Transcript_39250/m.45006 type:complete len:94 (-) Transcript_39250:28-309(-)
MTSSATNTKVTLKASTRTSESFPCTATCINKSFIDLEEEEEIDPEDLLTKDVYTCLDEKKLKKRRRNQPDLNYIEDHIRFCMRGAHVLVLWLD